MHLLLFTQFKITLGLFCLARRAPELSFHLGHKVIQAFKVVSRVCHTSLSLDTARLVAGDARHFFDNVPPIPGTHLNKLPHLSLIHN